MMLYSLSLFYIHTLSGKVYKVQGPGVLHVHVSSVLQRPYLGTYQYLVILAFLDLAYIWFLCIIVKPNGGIKITFYLYSFEFLLL